MNRNILLHSLLMLSLSLLLVIPSSAWAADLRVFCVHTVTPALEILGPDFERSTGNKLVILDATTGAIISRVNGGEVADLAIMAGPAARNLANEGKLVPASILDIGSTGISLAVRAGAPKPDISTEEAFKKTLLAAKSISFSDPADGGTSGIYFVSVLQRLGLADQLKSKSVPIGKGGSVGAPVASGEVELAIAPDSELLATKGIDIVGPLPGVFQKITVYSAGILPGSKNAAGAQSLIQFLKSAKAASVLKATGVQPPK